MKGLTDIVGIKVGHVSDYDGITGCTAIVCEGGAVAGYDIRGGASGTEEFEVMSPSHITPHIHALIFAGGSAFGLEAASGARRALEKKGIGFKTSVAVVPIVPAAIIFDLPIGNPKARPTREMGEAAVNAASLDAVQEGCVGAGTGATVGKYSGLPCAMKGGVGTFTIELPRGLKVSALVVVNAYGDVCDPTTGRIVAGTRTAPGSREFASTAKLLLQGGLAGGLSRENTTLAAVATNARLSKVQASRVAQLAHNGLARAVRPAHTSFDGDLIVAMSCGQIDAHPDIVGLAAADAVAEAILRAVRTAKTLGGVPGLAG